MIGARTARDKQRLLLSTTRLGKSLYDLRRSLLHRSASRCMSPSIPDHHQPAQEPVMTVTAAHISPLVALIGGILILLMPRLLNYIVAIYLILVGLIGLNAIHHFIR